MCISGLIFNTFSVCNAFYFFGRVIPLTTYQKPIFAVLPEIVPAPEFHRSVASLISSQGRITFGRSLNFQGAYNKRFLAKRKSTDETEQRIWLSL